MILSWMLYVSAVTLLVTLAAWVLEGVVRQVSLPVRGLWVGALLASLAIPLVIGAFSTERDIPTPLAGMPQVEPAPAATGPDVWVEWTEPVISGAAGPANLDVDSWLLVLWGLASLVSLLTVTLSYRDLNRRRLEWDQREVDGREVWVSPDTGPAVVGFLPGEIVLPDWLLAAETTERQIVLAHEEEHLRALDPAVLVGALLVWIAMPWNLGLWLLNQRLRRAVEIDCDLRVLHRGVDPRAYTRLLVDVTERGTTHRFAVAALAESPAFLERRIRLMLMPRSRWWVGRAAGSALVAGSMVLAACQVDRPEQSPIPATGATFEVEKDSSLTEQPDTTNVAVTGMDSAIAADGAVPAAALTAPPAALSDEEAYSIPALVREAIKKFHPSLLTESVEGGRVNVYLVADARGEMVKTGTDTQARTGSCMGGLQDHLGASVDRSALGEMGCGRFALGATGPNRVHYVFAALKPQPGEENAPPTGPFLFGEAVRRSRPSEEVLRTAIERHHPAVLREGLPHGESLWFIADRSRRVMYAGRGSTYGSSRTAELELQKKHPGVDIGSVLMSSQVRTATGDRISLVWATVKEPGSAPDPWDAPGRADPALHIRTFAVTSAAAGEPVRIRLEGEAADDPRAFRIDGSFSRQGDVLVARTPFTFVVVSEAPFSASFSTASSGEEIQLVYMADSHQSRLEGTQILLSRDRRGDPIQGGANARGRVVPLPESPPVITSAY